MSDTTMISLMNLSTFKTAQDSLNNDTFIGKQGYIDASGTMLSAVLPVATSLEAGVVKIGTGLQIQNGTISLSSQTIQQAVGNDTISDDDISGLFF